MGRKRIADEHAAELLAGLDENGVGPLLGPMVVTMVVARTTPGGARYLRSKRSKLGGRLDDSKQIASYHDGVLAEAWVRALAEHLGLSAGTPQELLESLAPDSLPEMRAHCTQGHRQCFEPDAPFEEDAESLKLARTDLATLAKKNIEVALVKSTVLCTRVLNHAATQGISRFTLDLHAMEQLVLDAQRGLGGPIDAVCGKVGGLMYYENEFGPLSGHLRLALEESRERSVYQFPSIGTLAFVRDADAGDGLVSLASIVGKWVRDRLMKRVVAHHRHFNELPDCSGYHDPVTRTFVTKSALSRKQRGFPEDCFARKKAAKT